MRCHRSYRGAATFLSIRAESFITVTVHGLKVFILSARMAISGSAASLLTVRHCSRTWQRYLSKLHPLRPVSFRYKQDPQEVKQYGLIAEETARVYPELVPPTCSPKNGPPRMRVGAARMPAGRFRDEAQAVHGGADH